MEWTSKSAAVSEEYFAESLIPDSCLDVSDFPAASPEPMVREDAQSPEIVVSLEKPFRILASKGNASGVLGYADDEVRGQLLDMFQGQGTRSFLLQCAIENASLAETTRITGLVLCDKWGRSGAVDATFSPFTGGGGAILGCHISFDSTEAIALAEALDDVLYPGAKAIVSAEYPHMVEIVNFQLTKMLGFSHNQSAGRGLVGLVCSPRTPAARLYGLIGAACEGRGTQEKLYLRNNAASDMLANVRFTPVLDPGSGIIKHVMALFALCGEGMQPSPCPALSSPSSIDASSHYLWGDEDQSSATVEALLVCPPQMSTTPLPAHGTIKQEFPSAPAVSDDPHGRLSCGGARRPSAQRQHPSQGAGTKGSRTGATIFPRRKAGENVRHWPNRGEGPIVVTLDLLDSLEQLPLNKAAERIGLSATAFKNACRKLGVRQWSYRKNRCLGSTSPGLTAAAEPSSPPACPLQSGPPSAAAWTTCVRSLGNPHREEAPARPPANFLDRALASAAAAEAAAASEASDADTPCRVGGRRVPGPCGELGAGLGFAERLCHTGSAALCT